MYMLSGPPSNHTAEPLSMPPIRHTYSCHHLREPPPPASPALQCRAMYMISVPRAVTLPYRSPCRRLRVPCHRLGGRAASPSVPPTMQRVTPCMPSVKTGLPRHHQRRAVSLRDRPTAANALRHTYPSPPPLPSCHRPAPAESPISYEGLRPSPASLAASHMRDTALPRYQGKAIT